MEQLQEKERKPNFEQTVKNPGDIHVSKIEKCIMDENKIMRPKAESSHFYDTKERTTSTYNVRM